MVVYGINFVHVLMTHWPLSAIFMRVQAQKLLF